jgi:hypothetical protein
MSRCKRIAPRQSCSPLRSQVITISACPPARRASICCRTSARAHPSRVQRHRCLPAVAVPTTLSCRAASRVMGRGVPTTRIRSCHRPQQWIAPMSSGACASRRLDAAMLTGFRTAVCGNTRIAFTMSCRSIILHVHPDAPLQAPSMPGAVAVICRAVCIRRSAVVSSAEPRRPQGKRRPRA